MQQEASFPSLDQVLDQYLHGFPRQALLNENVDTVRENMWRQLVEGKHLSIVQYMVVWWEYACEKQLNPDDFYYGLSNKDALAQLSREAMMSFSLQGLKSGLEQHLSIMNQWEQARREVTDTDINVITGEPPESEDEEARALVSASGSPTRTTARRKRSLPGADDEPEYPPPPPKRKRGRPRKHPLPEPAEAARSHSSATKRKRGRSRKQAATSKQVNGRSPARRKLSSEAAVVSPQAQSKSTSSAGDEQESLAERRTRRRATKPKHRFDPCAGHGRYWSEPGQPIRKVPQHALMSPAKKKKTTERMFDIERRGTTLGDYKPRSLWKYVCPKDNQMYIVEIANGKAISKYGRIEVTWRGYGRTIHRVPVSLLQVPTDKDFQAFEASYRRALQVAKG
jgi:hypothetical protein